MLRDERANRLLRGRTIEIELTKTVRNTLRAFIRLFIRNELRISKQPVLEIINTNLRCFLVANRTKMARDFESALVRFLDDGAQFSARDVHVGFERSGAEVSPVIYELARIVGSSKRVHHGREGTNSFEIRRRDVH